MRIGVDAGGTFTDFVVLHDDGRLETFKLRSDPGQPARVIREGIERAAGNLPVEVIHGSTVATNALLERKGVRTAFVTTAGFEDIAHIGRQYRAELYNLTPLPRVHLAPRSLCFGVDERSYFDGMVARRPPAAGLKRLRDRLTRLGVRSVAICFLHAYRNPANERAVHRALGDAFYACSSHDVCPEFREYERASTTLVNAYVGPLMDSYLAELEGGRARIFVMQSNGGSITTREARRHAVRTILSGPAGGVVGAAVTARLSGFDRVLGFDMGGTSTDVSLTVVRPRETTEASVDGFPIRVPMLDVHTVGAGGGSIARVDEGGLLRVGPESAGADPGPACYGVGSQATVTDAHVVLGRIAAVQFLGGSMTIEPRLAAQAVDRVAKALKVNRVAAAAGIIRVANSNMERAIRVVSVERGHDPRDFALVAFGGAGGLHACEIAAALGIRTVIVPQHAGALSALGMLLADRVRDYAAGVLGRTDIEEQFLRLERQARRDLPGAVVERFADLRYAGQSYELTIPWSLRVAQRFHQEHHRTYGYSNPRAAVETVTIRVRARLPVVKPHIQAPRQAASTTPEMRRVYSDGRWHRMPVFHREQLSSSRRRGPALIADYGATTLVPPGWSVRRGRAGNLLIEK